MIVYVCVCVCVFGKWGECTNEVIVCSFVVKRCWIHNRLRKVREVFSVQAEINSSANLRIMLGFGNKKNVGKITKNAQG